MKETIKSLMHSTIGFVIGVAMILTGILIQMERWGILKHWLYLTGIGLAIFSAIFLMSITKRMQA